MISSGNAGKTFVSRLASLFQTYADQSPIECIAFVMQMTMLQKPGATSKTRDHSNHLKRRLEMWLKGDINQLLDEGKCLQDCLPTPHVRDDFEAVSRKL